MKQAIALRSRFLNILKENHTYLYIDLNPQLMIDQEKFVTIHFKYGRILFDQDDLMLAKLKGNIPHEIFVELFQAIQALGINWAIVPCSYSFDYNPDRGRPQ